MSPTPVRPSALKSAAAMMSMLALMAPAMAMAITTSTSSKRKIFLFSSSVPAHHPALRQRRVQIDDVRHDRSAQDARRQQHALGAREPRREEPGEDAVGLGLGVEHLEGEGR